MTMAGATAAVAFPTLKHFNTQFGSTDETHYRVLVTDLPAGTEPDQFRFVAGAVAQPVFLISDIVAFACAVVAAGTLMGLIVSRAVPRRRPATLVRSIALAIAVACLASSLIVVTPQIVQASRLHLAAAKAGDLAAAAKHKQAVDELHPLSGNLLAGELVGALVALLAGCWSLAQPADAAPEPRKNPYPEPALRKRAA